MNIKDFLEYSIIQTDHFEVTPYSILMILIIIFVTWSLLWFLKKVFLRKGLSEKFEKGIGYTVFTIIKYIAWILAILLILEAVGIKLTLLLAGSAALLVGIGFGLQQFFKDVLSGVIILVIPLLIFNCISGPQSRSGLKILKVILGLQLIRNLGKKILQSPFRKEMSI